MKKLLCLLAVVLFFGDVTQTFAQHSGGHPTDGDPVDLYTGLYVRTTTDLSVDDTIPLTLVRTYRNDDHLSRAFGVGTSHSYDMFIVGDAVSFSYVELVFDDGARSHFNRISPGTGYADAVFQNTTASDPFNGSRIDWIDGHWKVSMPDGSSYLVHGCGPGTTRPGQCGLIEYRRADGLSVTIDRNEQGDIKQIVSPTGKFIRFDYDQDHHIKVARASSGATAEYDYDDKGRLTKVRSPGKTEILYGYDDEDQMTSVLDQDQIIQNSYQGKRCVYQHWQSGSDVVEFQFRYVFGERQNLLATEVIRSGNHLRRVSFAEDGQVSSEAREVGRPEETTVSYSRDPHSQIIQKVTAACSSPKASIHLTATLADSRVLGSDFYDNLHGLCREAATGIGPPDR